MNSSNSDILYEAVCASGANKLDRAWKQVIELARNEETEKYLLMASIEAAFEIRPDEAGPILVDLSNHEDHDVGLLVNECMVLAEDSEDELYEYDEYDDQESIH